MRRIYCVNVSERTWMSEELSSSKFFVHSQEQLDGSYKEVDAETKTGTTGTKPQLLPKYMQALQPKRLRSNRLQRTAPPSLKLNIIEMKYPLSVWPLKTCLKRLKVSLPTISFSVSRVNTSDRININRKKRDWDFIWTAKRWNSGGTVSSFAGLYSPNSLMRLPGTNHRFAVSHYFEYI